MNPIVCLWRRFVLLVSRPPVRGGCYAYNVECLGWCGLTNKEQRRQYLENGYVDYQKALRGRIL